MLAVSTTHGVREEMEKKKRKRSVICNDVPVAPQYTSDPSPTKVERHPPLQIKATSPTLRARAPRPRAPQTHQPAPFTRFLSVVLAGWYTYRVTTNCRTVCLSLCANRETVHVKTVKKSARKFRKLRGTAKRHLPHEQAVARRWLSHFPYREYISRR